MKKQKKCSFVHANKQMVSLFVMVHTTKSNIEIKIFINYFQAMNNIEVSKIIDPIPASDGAGVKLKRSIGVEPNYFDPFLMLDEFGSENSEDYIAGFPPHPHRGIETVLIC